MPRIHATLGGDLNRAPNKLPDSEHDDLDSDAKYNSDSMITGVSIPKIRTNEQRKYRTTETEYRVDTC